MSFEATNKIISVTGARDGVGKSTLVANLAVLLSSSGTKRVLAVELDPRHFRDLQVLLGAMSYQGEITSLSLETDIISQSFVKVSTAWSSVEILYPQPITERERLVKELYDIEDYMKSTYEYVIMDVGAADSVFVETSIPMSDHVIVVSLNDSMGILALRKYLKSSHFELAEDSVTVVINRTQHNYARQEREEIAKALRVRQVFCIQNDLKLISKSLNSRKLVSTAFVRSGISRNLADLACMIQRSDAFTSKAHQEKQIQKRWFKKLDKKENLVALTDSNKALLHETQVNVLKNRIHTRLLDELNTASFAIIRDDIDINSREGKELVAAKIRSVLEEEVEDAFIQQGAKNRLVHELLDELLGLGPLETYLRDDTITEIMVVGCKQIYIERGGKLELADKRFASELQIRNVIDRIISPLGRRIDESSPMVDARLADGSRVNVVIPPLSLNGSLITIRKFPKEGFTVQQLIENGTLTQESVNYLYDAVVSRKNIIISGGTGSGKTTLLNILSGFVPRNERIVTIEDAAELQLDQEHVCSLEARPANIESRGEVTIRDLVRNALRMRPDRIIVGEVRGGEALDMLQAMNTGHTGSLTTCHANSTKDSLSRLEIMVLMAGMELPVRAIQSQIASAIDIIIQVQRLEDGSRRVVEIAELQGLDERGFILKQVY